MRILSKRCNNSKVEIDNRKALEQQDILQELIESSFRDLERDRLRNFYGSTEQLLQVLDKIETEKQDRLNQIQKAFPYLISLRRS